MGIILAELASIDRKAVENVFQNGNLAHETWVFHLRNLCEHKDINSKLEILKYSRFLIIDEMNLLEDDVTKYFAELFSYGKLGINRAFNLLTMELALQGENLLRKNIKEAFALFFSRLAGE